MQRVRVFILTWVSYATYYFARKNFPVAKATIQSELGVSTAGLAAIDTVYLSTYAVGQFAGGWLGDRIGSRRLVGYGMILSALLICGFGASSSTQLFALFFGLNGFVQATGWPGNVKAMAGWYGPSERGKVMGFWSTCFQVGPFAATALAVFLMGRFGWRTAFFGPAIWVGLVGLLVLLFLQEKTVEAVTSVKIKGAASEALRNPIVWLLGASYFGMKLIRYCIDFWLPYYLQKSLGYQRETAGYLSLAFQFGGVFGAVAVGWISDRYFPGRRGAVATVCTVALAVALLVYGRVAGLGLWVNFASMAVVGFFLFGPDALISGVAAPDLGGPRAAATVAGFINGCGSVGAIAQGVLVAGVSNRFGWEAVFQALMVLAAISSVSLGAVWRLQRQRATPAAVA